MVKHTQTIRHFVELRLKGLRNKTAFIKVSCTECNIPQISASECVVNQLLLQLTVGTSQPFVKSLQEAIRILHGKNTRNNVICTNTIEIHMRPKNSIYGNSNNAEIGGQKIVTSPVNLTLLHYQTKSDSFI